MATEEMQLASLIWQVRRLFQRLTSESNDILAVFGITVSQRAVLQFLDHNEAETLANMARAHDVSRQHIQQIVNELLEKGLVETVDNPAHKRSFLVRRTAAGEALFAKVQQVETALFKAITPEIETQDILTSSKTLQQLNEVLHSSRWEQLKRQQLKDRETV